MKYYLKRFIPIYKTANIICMGFAQKTGEYIEIAYNNDNIASIKALLESGITEENLGNPLYKLISACNFLETTYRGKNDEINRGNLFLNYLDVENPHLLKDKRILVFGAGAGGNTLIYMLAQFGIKNIMAIDYDIVSESDIFRVSIFDKSDVGRYKVDALKDRISRNFDISISTLVDGFTEYDKLLKVVTEFNPDFIVKACDPSSIFRVNLNKICFERQIPFFMMAYSFESLNIGPLYVPCFTSCDESLNILQKKSYGEHYDFKDDKRLFSDLILHPSISFNINMLASFAFKEIIMFLSSKYEYCFSIGRLIEFNPLSLDFHSFDAICDSSCTICTSLKEVIV